MRAKKTIARVLPWLVLLAAYVLAAGFFAAYGAHNLNADDSSEMVLAAQLNEEGKILTENWLYSTELRIISPVPLYQLGLKVFPDDWHAARTLARSLVLLGIAAATVYLARGIGMKKSAPLAAAVFLLPFSSDYGYVMILGCYYAVHMILAFLMLGLVCRFGQRGLRSGWMQLLLAAALGFFGGFGGVRMLTMLIAPLAAAAAVLALCELTRHDTFRAAAHEPAVRIGGAAVLAAGLAGAGYLLHNALFVGRYSYYGYSDMRMNRFKLADFSSQIDGIVRTLGYRDDAALFSAQGIGCWVALLLAAMVVLALFCLAQRAGELTAQQKLAALTAVCAVVLGMLLNVLLGQFLVRYFIIGTMLLLMMIFLALETQPCRNGMLRAIALGAVVCCFAFQTLNVLRYDYRQGDVNYEIAADWLKENGYTQGYATFWNANTIAEASDGEIKMWVLGDSKHGGKRGWWSQMRMQDMLQDRRHLSEDPQGKVFLLVDEAEYAEGSPLLSEEHLVGELVAWSYYVYEYENAAQMRELIAQAQ